MWIYLLTLISLSWSHLCLVFLYFYFGSQMLLYIKRTQSNMLLFNQVDLNLTKQNK